MTGISGKGFLAVMMENYNQNRSPEARKKESKTSGAIAGDYAPCDRRQLSIILGCVADKTAAFIIFRA